MFKLCLQRTLRHTVSSRAVLESVTAGKVLKVSHVQSCWMGTLGLNEQREHLNSPKRAKEFIYSLHPKERTCLLKELQSFESIAIAQGKITDIARKFLSHFIIIDIPSLTPSAGRVILCFLFL